MMSPGPDGRREDMAGIEWDARRVHTGGAASGTGCRHGWPSPVDSSQAGLAGRGGVVGGGGRGGCAGERGGGVRGGVGGGRRGVQEVVGAGGGGRIGGGSWRILAQMRGGVPDGAVEERRGVRGGEGGAWEGGRGGKRGGRGEGAGLGSGCVGSSVLCAEGGHSGKLGAEMPKGATG